jgi:hypothetical protein
MQWIHLQQTSKEQGDNFRKHDMQHDNKMAVRHCLSIKVLHAQKLANFRLDAIRSLLAFLFALL